MWKYDLLGRKNDAEFLIAFIEKRLEERTTAGDLRNYVLNIDSEWGQGKTFFLTNLQDHLNSMGRICVYINAWEDDHADDPLIAVMSEINQSIKPYLSKKVHLKKAWDGMMKNTAQIAGEIGKAASKQLFQKVLGEGAQTVSEVFDTSARSSGSVVADTVEAGTKAAQLQIESLLDQYATKPLKQFETKKQSMSEFRDRLTELVESINNINNNDFPMYILIDELDRCRPTYAIALLERIKHLFSAENVVFLIATDTNQLQHAISAVYGVGFDGARYLQRFFDRTYLFERPNIESFVRKLFHRYQVDSSQLSATVGDAEEYFNKMMSYCELSLRDIERCFDILRGSITLWDQETPLELIYLLPLIIKHSTRDDEGFRRLAELDTSYLRGSIFDNKHAYEVIVEVNGGGTRKTVMNSMLVGEVISRLKKPLMDALDSKYSSVFDIFQREFQVIQNLRLNPQNPPGQSVLLTYPLLVRGSARFSDPAL